MLKKDIPNGVIIYEGPSLIDGKPIVVIANSLKISKNSKIGDMIQTWILRSDIHPNNALKTGADSSICGGCMHRGEYDKETDTMKNRTCYVNLMTQGVFSIYNAYKRGSYPIHSNKYLEIFTGRHFRIGSYGDPAAVPSHIWKNFITICKDYTGYTHQWRTCNNEYSQFLMASCEKPEHYELAKSKGWRTFRVIVEADELKFSNEIPCPAQIDNAHCDRCSLCDGVGKKPKKDITVVFHGSCGRKEQYLEKIRAN